MRPYVLGLLAAVICSCSEGETSMTQTVVSNSAVNQRLDLLERRFTKQQLCEDYRLFDLLLRDLHFEPQDGAGGDAPCPNSFRDYAYQLKERIARTQDLHSTVTVGFGLDASSYPVVRSCVPEQACSQIVGSQFMSLASASKNKFYAMATDTEQKGLLFEIIGIGDEPLHKQALKFAGTFELPSGDETWPYYFPDFLLKRSALDGRSKDDLNALVLNVQNKQLIKMVLSYEDRQTIVPSPTVSYMNRQIEFARTYACTESSESASPIVGACLGRNKKGVLWVSEWPQLDDSFEEMMRKQLSWLDAKAPQDQPLILDLSGNQGGSPLAVANFLCMIGDDIVQESMENYQIASRVWPEFFDLGTRTLATSTLPIAINTDLKFIEEGWTAKALDLPSTRQRISGFLQRSGLTSEACRALRLPNFDRRQWLVVTNGQEFSASEDFLQIASQSRGKFTTIGYRSAGGVGAPTWVVLPHTQSRVRISPSRTLYKQSLVIEKQGLSPTLSSTVSESETVFLQKALHALATDGAFNPSLSPTKPLLKSILRMTPDAFRSLTYLGRWSSACMNGAKTELQFSLDKLTAVHRKFQDTECQKEQTSLVHEFKNPWALLTSPQNRTLWEALEMPSGACLDLQRAGDEASLRLCAGAEICP